MNAALWYIVGGLVLGGAAIWLMMKMIESDSDGPKGMGMGMGMGMNRRMSGMAMGGNPYHHNYYIPYTYPNPSWYGANSCDSGCQSMYGCNFY